MCILLLRRVEFVTTVYFLLSRSSNPGEGVDRTLLRRKEIILLSKILVEDKPIYLTANRV